MQITTKSHSSINELEQVRLDKCAKLRQLGINPYHKSLPVKDNHKSLLKKYQHLSQEELKSRAILTSVAGRITSMRGPFFNLNEKNQAVQIYLAKDLEGVQNVAKLLDLGDIIWAKGTVMKTGIGQIAIRVLEIKVLTKTLRPMPEKWKGLTNVEERYRHRYLDLMSNQEVKNIFWTRSRLISWLRNYLDKQDYLEVETPILQSVLGGAAARPFSTYHNTLHQSFYLRIATELPLKKLLVGGFERVYEIGRLFRNEGIDTSHNPEFTSVEFYQAYSDLEGMMSQTEKLFKFLASQLKRDKFRFREHLIDLNKPFKRLKMVDAVSKATGVNFDGISFEKARQVAQNHKLKILPYFKTGHIINELFELLVEPTLIQPTFVTNYPVEISPLAADCKQEPGFVERAELFIASKEFANMFTELNDPTEQLARFEKQLEERQAGNEEANEIDFDFINALKHGMPPAGGCGIGIDRLVMLFTEQDSIRQVLLFPHLRIKGHQDA
ncbi:lysine--tRNA ligase [Mycoplasma sp. ATU-Cv-508]|uniref:lysine--tRNA ligase n=1 Tax=Mycoplasma sp. ATU-Cv-508 TaxID=2048001 RepID=UPI000FDDFF55